MKTEIQSQLIRLEDQYDIKILYAVESGSRAWGFASVNSDWDVRFIYIHRPEWYFKIDAEKDSMEEILDNDIDLAGWELKKTLRLFRKSNPPLLEWLGSPIIYSEQYSTAEKMRKLKEIFFNPKSCMHHYLHMAERNFSDYINRENVRVKKYFYVLRPLLACDWIRKNNTMAPTEFSELVNDMEENIPVQSEIQALLLRKMSGEELSEEPRNEILFNFLQSKLNFYQEFVQSFQTPVAPDTDLLNAFFIEQLLEAWKK